MPHIRSCLLVAEVAIVAGAALVAVARHALHLRRGANYSLADALGGGAVGGLLGAAAGCAICVARDGTANPGGGWLAAWLFRFLPFGGLGIVEGAVVGLLAGVGIAMVAARRARRSTGA
ncbi:MAG: hypothetical protein ABR499_16760 [Gemmatimonadaceae bacterium]